MYTHTHAHTYTHAHTRTRTRTHTHTRTCMISWHKEIWEATWATSSRQRLQRLRFERRLCGIKMTRSNSDSNSNDVTTARLNCGVGELSVLFHPTVSQPVLLQARTHTHTQTHTRTHRHRHRQTHAHTHTKRGQAMQAVEVLENVSAGQATEQRKALGIASKLQHTTGGGRVCVCDVLRMGSSLTHTHTDTHRHTQTQTHTHTMAWFGTYANV